MHRNWVFQAFVSLIALIVVSGCVETIGEGPITFSPSTARNYQSYLETQHAPMAFAVTTDGEGSFYYYCPWRFAGSCENLADTTIIYECEKRYSGKVCRVFDRKRNVVWKNPGDFLNSAQSVRAKPRATSDAKEQTRRGIAQWEGVGELPYRAKLYLVDTGGFSTVLFDNGLKCEAYFRYTGNNGANWQATCEDGEKIKGTLIYDTEAGTSTATGKDTRGRTVTLNSSVEG